VIFKEADLTVNYPLMHWVSEGGQWEMGIYPVLYGWRVAMGRVKEGSYLRGGYCIGKDMVKANLLILMLMAIFKQQPEELTERDALRFLPEWELRPIGYPGDPCWEAFRKLSEEALEQEQEAEPKSSNSDAVLETTGI
jgi:hypothetical protein